MAGEPGEGPAAPVPPPVAVPAEPNGGGEEPRTNPRGTELNPSAPVPPEPPSAVANVDTDPGPEVSVEVDVTSKKFAETSGASEKADQPLPSAEDARGGKPAETLAKPSADPARAEAGTLGTTTGTTDAPSQNVKRKAMSGLMARLAKPKARRRSTDGSDPASNAPSTSGAPAATSRPNPTGTRGGATATSGAPPSGTSPSAQPPPEASEPAPLPTVSIKKENPSLPAEKPEAEASPAAAPRAKRPDRPSAPLAPPQAWTPDSSQDKDGEGEPDELRDQEEDEGGDEGNGNAAPHGSLAGSSSDGARDRAAAAYAACVRKRTPSAVAKAAAETEAEVARARATGTRGRGKVTKGPRRGFGGRGRGSKAGSKASSALDAGDRAAGAAESMPSQRPSAKSSKKTGGGDSSASGAPDDENDYEDSGGDQGASAEDNSKTRKSYVSTKTREVWSAEEHERFLEAVEKFGRKWKSVAEFVNTRTPVQIRSHAQKYYNKLTREGNQAVIPPPRRKRKPQPSSQQGEPGDSQPRESHSGQGGTDMPSASDQEAVISKPPKSQKRSSKASPASKGGATSEKPTASQTPGIEGNSIPDVMGLPNDEELKDWGPQGSFPDSGSMGMGMGIEMDMAMGMEMGIDMRPQPGSQQQGMPPQGGQQQLGSRMGPGSSQQQPPPQQQMPPRGMITGEQQASPAGEESCAMPPIMPMGRRPSGPMMYGSMGGPGPGYGPDSQPRIERGPMDRPMGAMEGMDRRPGGWEGAEQYGGQGGRFPPSGWGDERGMSGGGSGMPGAMDELGEMMDTGPKGQPMGPQGGSADGGPGMTRQHYMNRMGYSDVDSDQSMGSRWPMGGNGSPAMYGPSGMYGSRPMGMRGPLRDPSLGYQGYPRGMDMPPMMGGPGSYRGMMDDVPGPRGGMAHHMGYGYMDGLRGMEMESRMYRGKMIYGPGPERGMRGPPEGPRGMVGGMSGFKGGSRGSPYDHDTSPNYSHDDGGMPMGGMSGRGGDMYMDQMGPPHAMARGRRSMYEGGPLPPYAGVPQQHWRYMQQGQRPPPEMQGKGAMGASPSPTEGDQYQGGGMPGDIPPGRGIYESPSFQPMGSGGSGGGMGGMDGPPMPGPGRQTPQAWNDQQPQDGGGPPPDQMISRYGMYPMQR